MDTSTLDAYAPDPESVAPTPRQLKEEAFYTAATTAPKEEMEIVYDRLMDDFTRFGRSDLYEDAKENWKRVQQEEASFKASEVLLNTNLPLQDKRAALESLAESVKSEVTPKDAYVKQITPAGKEPMEITVTGGLTEQEYDKKYGEWKNSPRSKISGAFADFLIKAKRALDQYEVADWAPLLGGVGVGEIVVGDAARLWDEISYYGLNRIFVYDPVAPGGRDNPLNYKLDKGVIDTIFLGMDVAGLAALGKEGAKAVIQGAVDNAVKKGAIRIEPTLKESKGVPVGEIIYFDKDAPVGVVSRINKPEAADLLSTAVKSPKIADAIGTSKTGIVEVNLLPKLDASLEKVYPDIYEKIVAADRQTLYYFDANKVDPYLFDVTAIKGDVDMHYRIMREQSEVTPNMASSYVEDTGRALRWKQVFGKEANRGFDDPLEAMDARDKLIERIARNYSEELTGKSYDSLRNAELKKLHNKVGDKVHIFVDPDSKEAFLKWEGARLYDPAVDTFLGYGATSAKLAHWEVGSLANTSVGKWFYEPAARLPKWITAGFARASMRATNMEKVWAEMMRQEVLATRPRRELAQAIYKTEEVGENLSINGLREMFPTMGSKDFKSLVNGYFNYRRLIDYQYMVINDVYRTQKVTAGFKGLFDSNGNHLGLGRPVKPEDPIVDADGVLTPGKKLLIGSDGGEVRQVYDFSLIDQVDEATGQTTKVQKGAVDTATFDVNSVEVYKLDRPIKRDGQVFEYGINVKEGQVPTELLPKIPGYYPHINDEHYFIKAIPKSLILNGKRIPNDAEHAALYAEHAGTVNVARTQKSGEALAAKLSKENPDFDYKVVFERSEIDDTLRTSLDTIKYAQDVAKSRREERLTLPDGTLGRLEDPAVALDQRMNQAARLYAWKDIDFEFRQQFLKEYGHLTKGVFPRTAADIELPPNVADDFNEKMYKNALNIFEQYTKQQRHAETLLDPIWQSATLNIGRFMEEVSPVSSDILKNLSHKREPVLSSALKLATLKYIHLNPLKQYIIQPAQLWELNALAASMGNLRFSRDLANLTGGLFADAITRGSDKISPAFKKLLRDTGHVPTGYSAKEYQEILDAFWNSGIPKSIDLNAMLDGVFKSASDELDVGAVKHATDRAAAIARGVIQVPKQLGYNPAELINQIGLWLYARSEFIRLNPKKVWNDPHNLELIAEKAWGVGNTMLTRASLLPYQEGTMRAFMQFTAVTNKGTMQPLVSKFLTKEEKTRLAAIRIAAFGEKGIVALPLAIEAIKYQHYKNTENATPSEIAEDTPSDQFYKFAERGLHDLFINKLLNLMFRPEEGGPKTDLMLTKNMALGTETGIPMGDFFRDLYKWAKGEGKASDVMPFLPATAAVFDTFNVFWDLLQAKEWEEKQEKGRTIEYILKTSEFASGYSNFEKGLAMLHYDSIVSKHKGDMQIAATNVEAVAKMLGIPSYKEDALYTVLKQDAKLKKEIQNSVKKAIASLHAIEDVYDGAAGREGPATAEEVAKRYHDLAQRVKHLSAIYAGVHLESEFEEEFWRQLDKEHKDTMDGVISRMMNRHGKEYDKNRREMYEKLNMMKQSGDKKLADLISNLAFEIENVDKEEK